MRVLQADIRDVDPLEFMEACGLEPGQLDVLVGGPPCQAFSHAGRRQSVADPRGELLWEFQRFVIALQPKFFLMENVRSLTSAALRHRKLADRPERGGPPLEPDEQPGSVLDLWVDDLRGATRGTYRLDCFEVNAVNYGAPQLRERAIFVGNRLGMMVNWPAPTHGQSQHSPEVPSLFGELKPYVTLREAIGHIREDDPVLMDFSPRKKRYLAMVPPGGNWRSLPEDVQQESMGRAWYAKGGRSGWWRRLSWDLPCPTVVTMPNHASTSMCHPDEVRVLSVTECAAVQGFPEAFEFVGKPLQQYEQVGNAVPVRLGEVAGEVISRHLDAWYERQDGQPPGSLSDQRGKSALPAFRKVYLNSQVRTRQWYKAGEVFLWEDGGDNGHAQYSASRRSRQRG